MKKNTTMQLAEIMYHTAHLRLKLESLKSNTKFNPEQNYMCSINETFLLNLLDDLSVEFNNEEDE